MSIITDISDYLGFNDFEDWASYAGFVEAAFNLPRRVFNSEEIQLIYDLAYDSELYSNALMLSSKHSKQVFIRSWDDLIGMGILEWVERGAVHNMPFTYHDLKPEHWELDLQPGTVITMIYDLKGGVPRIIDLTPSTSKQIG